MRKKDIHIPSCRDCQLCDFSILNSVDQKDLDILSDSKMHLFIKKGQPIYNKGNLAHGLYAIYKGKVKIIQELPNGQSQIVDLLKPGDVFGVKALIYNQKYWLSATALEDCSLCLIAKEDFEKLFHSSHFLKNDIIKKMVDEIGVLHNRLELLTLPARARTFKTLLLLKNIFGIVEETGLIQVELTRKDLASLANLSLETIVRLLSDIKKEGIIEIQNKQIFIKNHKAFFKETEM